MTARATNIQGEISGHREEPDHSALSRFWQHLHNPRFWAVQVLVILATSVHWGFELLRGTTDTELEGLFIVVMYAVYFVPVIYASLNFGREGAIPTAIWAAVLGIPSILLWHSGIHRLVDSAQHLTIIGLAVIIANRVDREVSARHEAERESRARRLSEARYRSLFDAAGDAILVFDDSGTIREANATAGERFGRTTDQLAGSSLEDVLGLYNAELLLHAARSEGSCRDDLVITGDSGPAWLEPICSRVRSNGDPTISQVVLRDVTADRERRQGLELYTRQVIQAQEEERRRIARELHDSPLQSLILLHRKLDVIESQSTTLPDEETLDQLSDVRHHVVDIADELRRFSRDLRPSILDDLGLVPAVRWLATDLADRSEIAVEFETSGVVSRLSENVELGLFRIAQEALRNIERHARASHAFVTLTYEDRLVRLEVRDNGVGFGRSDDPVTTATDAGKLGLLGMQERARLLGGDLAIHSSDRGGTRVKAELPADPGEPKTRASSPAQS